jgi:fatty-acyl-CoA synthase
VPTCFDWPARHAAHRPDEIAVATADSGFQLTWAEVEQRVARLAHLLAAEFDVGPGDRVALLAESDARYFELQFAAIRLGAIFVPLNIRLADAELAAVLADCTPRVLIHDPASAATATRVADRTLAWDDGPHASRYDRVRDPDAPGLAARRLDPDAVAQIMYTSGTTGRPKGVLCTNGAMAANAINMAHTSRCADRDAHALNFVPLFHAGGLNIFCNPVLYWGGRVTTTRGFDPGQALALLTAATLGATVTNGVLQMFERIAELPEFAAARFPTLRVTLFGGFGPTAQRTHAQWLGRGTVLQLGYGSTELGPMACMNVNPDDGAMVRGEFGRPVPLVELRCVDDTGAELTPGETGEIEVRGPAVTAGYWGGGHDGLTAEVEAAYVDLPGVVELAVTGVPDERWGEVGLLVIVAQPGVRFTLEDVRRHADGRLSRFKLPQHLQLVDALPRSTTLKVARNDLRTAFVNGAFAAQPATATG